VAAAKDGAVAARTFSQAAAEMSFWLRRSKREPT
jgi:hypothetical protein